MEVETMKTNRAPFNPATGQVFSLKNTAELLRAMAMKQYSDVRWAGFGQWKTLNRVVKGGEKATHIAMMKTKKVVEKEGRERVVTFPLGLCRVQF
jgi:antirestriction protein ArdC